MTKLEKVEKLLVENGLEKGKTFDIVGTTITFWRKGKKSNATVIDLSKLTEIQAKARIKHAFVINDMNTVELQLDDLKDEVKMSLTDQYNEKTIKVPARALDIAKEIKKNHNMKIKEIFLEAILMFESNVNQKVEKKGIKDNGRNSLNRSNK